MYWTPSTGSTFYVGTELMHMIMGFLVKTIGPDFIGTIVTHSAILDMEPVSTLNTDDGSSTAIPTGSFINTSGVDIDVVPDAVSHATPRGRGRRW